MNLAGPEPDPPIDCTIDPNADPNAPPAGNLGLWSSDAGYAKASRALIDAVGRAAALCPGQRVLSVACGAGDELLRWLGPFGVQQVTGVEADARRVLRAKQRITQAGWAGRGTVVAASALDWMAAQAPATFDAVLCVDAAYHLSPRPRWLAQAQRLLVPGGRLAFTDLVLEPGGRSPQLLRAAAALCGVPHADLGPAAQRLRHLQAAGFADVQLQRLDDAVLGGFVRHVHQQRSGAGWAAWHPGWLRPALTAALIGPCRRAGLGYALFSAHKANC